MRKSLKIVKILIGVVAGIVVLMVILSIPAARAVREQARLQRTTLELQLIGAASTNFSARVGRWPRTAGELTSNSMGWTFLTLPTPWKDAWGHPVVYTPFSPSNGYGSALSYGRDGRAGGSGVEADIEVRFP